MSEKRITSLQNYKVRRVRELQKRKRARWRERCFVVEGIRWIEELLRANLLPHYVFYTEKVLYTPRVRRALQALQARDVPCYEVGQAVVTACSDTETPQGILAVSPMPENAPPARVTLTLVIDGIRNPGNMGTILRTALAAGVEQVLLTGNSVDVYNPKVVRAAMGAHLHLSMRWPKPGDLPADLVGCDVWLADADAQGGIPYTMVDWTPPVALIVGGEAAGATAKARTLAQATIFIPMAPVVESLNVAVATAVILFEIVRQRVSLDKSNLLRHNVP